jgi:hypothetical protein
MDSSTLVLMENVITLTGHAPAPTSPLLNGLVSLLGQNLARVGLETSEVHTPNAVASARGTRPKLLYVRVGSGTICSEWS